MAEALLATLQDRPRRNIRHCASEQADIFAGGFHSKSRRGEVSHAVLSLVGTIVGGGSLSIPWAVNQAGFAMGLGLLVVAAFISCISVHFLLGSARRYGGLRSYDHVLLVAAGRPGQIATILSVVLTTFLTLVANQLLLRQLLSPLAGQILHRELTHWEAVGLGCGAVTLVVPLTFCARHVTLASHAIPRRARASRSMPCRAATPFHSPLVLADGHLASPLPSPLPADSTHAEQPAARGAAERHRCHVTRRHRRCQGVHVPARRLRATDALDPRRRPSPRAARHSGVRLHVPLLL